MLHLPFEFLLFQLDHVSRNKCICRWRYRAGHWSYVTGSIHGWSRSHLTFGCWLEERKLTSQSPSIPVRFWTELPAYELLLLLRSERSLHERVSEAADLLLSNGFANDGDDPPAETTTEKRSNSDTEASSSDPRDEAKKTEEKVCLSKGERRGGSAVGVLVFNCILSSYHKKAIKAL